MEDELSLNAIANSTSDEQPSDQLNMTENSDFDLSLVPSNSDFEDQSPASLQSEMPEVSTQASSLNGQAELCINVSTNGLSIESDHPALINNRDLISRGKFSEMNLKRIVLRIKFLGNSCTVETISDQDAPAPTSNSIAIPPELLSPQPESQTEIPDLAAQESQNFQPQSQLDPSPEQPQFEEIESFNSSLVQQDSNTSQPQPQLDQFLEQPQLEETETSLVQQESNTSQPELQYYRPPEKPKPEEDDDEIPDEAEMSLFDHLEELRQRIFYSIVAVAAAIVGCFIFVNPIVQILERPAQGVKFIQLAPGEYFFVSLKVAGYSGLLLASPFILYQIIQFVLPGLTRRERRLIGPIILGSTGLFLVGLLFSYIALIPAALRFFMSYGAGVVEELLSIERYFEFVLVLLFSTGLAFQVPIIQVLLGALGIVSSQQMLAGWRYVILSAAVLGAVLTPSTDPVTQSLLGGAVLSLYFGGIALVKLIGK